MDQSFALKWDATTGSFQVASKDDTISKSQIPAPFSFSSYSCPDSSRSFSNQTHTSYPSSQKKTTKRWYGSSIVDDSNRGNTAFSGSFYCKNCDRRFRDKKLYDQHVGEHVKCGVEGCPYTAHFKLILQHFQLQHCSSGMTRKVWQLDTPEDIEKWRAERRKNFPTQQKIAEKKEKQELAKQEAAALKKSKIDAEEVSTEHAEYTDNCDKRKNFHKFNRKQSLLEKVLAGDLARENAFILQCIRHVVGNKFYRKD